MKYLSFATRQSGPRPLEAPECLVLAIDVSPSMEADDWPPTRLRAAQDAAIALIQRKLKISPSDHVGIIAYSDDAAICSRPRELGRHSAELIRAVNSLQVGSGTDITAALKLVQRVLLPWLNFAWLRRMVDDSPAHHPSIQQRVILLTDGHHNGHGTPCSRSLRRDGVFIDCIGIGGCPAEVNEDLLRSIASNDPGSGKPRYAFIGDRDQLIERFQYLAGRIAR